MSRFLASTSVTAGTLSHEKLCKSPFFAECEAAFLTRLIKDLAVELFTAGDVIVEQGDHADKMYYLMMGEVEILVGHDRVRVAKLQEGTVFGEMAMFSHLGNGFARRSATIRAANFCDTRVINKDRFHAILKQHPKEKLRFEGIAQERKAKLDKSKAILRPEAKLELRPTAQNTSAASQAVKLKALLGRRASLPVSWANRKEGPAEVEESPKETPAEKLRRSLLSSVSSSSLGDYEVSKVKQEPTYVPMPDAIEEDDASSSESSFGSEEEAVQVEAARQTAPSPVVCCPKGRRPRVASLLVALRQVASPTPGPRPMRSGSASRTPRARSPRKRFVTSLAEMHSKMPPLPAAICRGPLSAGSLRGEKSLEAPFLRRRSGVRSMDSQASDASRRKAPAASARMRRRRTRLGSAGAWP